MIERRRLRVTGTVQGVGFRPFVFRLATGLGLAGQVSNDHLGVLIEVEGPDSALDILSTRLVAEAPPLALVVSVESGQVRPTGETGFAIVDSRSQGAPAVAVSVDAATCAECLSELHDPTNRRFGYPFINCTNCGPRYTIIQSIPYDRAATTMAGFDMCARCGAEYTNPADRRFHAEPIACADCGPRLTLLDSGGGELATESEALGRAISALLAGQILAIKGLGGYHLAADATNTEAVTELRRRKSRDQKPFAVMVPGLESAGELCLLTSAAEAALASPRRPIVLAPRHHDQILAAGVAPGLPELGLMLPYTPLHSLVMAGLGRPLVLTSGNQSDEPIAHDDADALSRLGPMVDAIVSHDRPIHIRCDDSVVRARPGEGSVQMVRRSRGYAPEPINLTRPAGRHVLAVGAELKNTVAVAKGATIVASHHIGDLEHLAAYQSFLQAVGHLCRLTGVRPAMVVHDLHPEYLSTKFAMDLEIPALGVQHHHAHIASCLAEHGSDARVLGVAFDGTGMGTDGTIWGGEFLVADLDGFTRVGHLTGVPMIGGNHAVREPWRMAMAWVHAACGYDEAAHYGSEIDHRWSAVLDRIASPSSLITTSAGRLFDAVAALIGLRSTASYEAQAAIELEAAAVKEPLTSGDGYEVVLRNDNQGCLELDPSPLVRTVMADQRTGTASAVIAARFHEGLGLGVAQAAVVLADAHGLDTVALSGGVFQNARLSAIVETDIAKQGLRVLVHSHIPPNDGGISIGQAAIAARLS